MAPILGSAIPPPHYLMTTNFSLSFCFQLFLPQTFAPRTYSRYHVISSDPNCRWWNRWPSSRSGIEDTSPFRSLSSRKTSHQTRGLKGTVFALQRIVQSLSTNVSEKSTGVLLSERAPTWNPDSRDYMLSMRRIYRARYARYWTWCWDWSWNWPKSTSTCTACVGKSRAEVRSQCQTFLCCGGKTSDLLTLGLEDHIKYDKSFVKYETTENGMKTFFRDGSVEEGTFLVGAEGVISAVREQFLPNYRYVDTGTRCLYGKTPLTDEFVARFTPMLSRGMGVIKNKTDSSVFLEAMRFPCDALIESNEKLTKVDDHMYWVFIGDAESIGLDDSQFHDLSGEAAAALTAELTKDWHPSISCLFQQQGVSQCAPLHLVSARPARPDWKSSASVTLLGDAVHAMMPTGGSGANTALADAALLLELIIQEGISESVLTKYVDRM